MKHCPTQVELREVLAPFRDHPDSFISTHNRAVAIAVQAMEAEGVEPRIMYAVAHRMLSDDRFSVAL